MTQSRQVAQTGGLSTVAGFGREFLTGAGFLLRGIGLYARNPRLMLLGLLPAVIVGVLLVAAFFGMIAFVDDAVRLATTFAEDWPAGLRGATRFLVAVGVMAGWIMLSILAFVALTLLVGQPFYEAISKQVEDQLGGVPNEVNVSFWRSLPRTLAGSARSIAISVLVAIVTFGVGLVPVAGQIAAPVLGATLGGWLLTLELSGIAFERRGMYFRQRRQVLRARRPMALGFGVATFVCFLIPLGAVLIMPAAVAGATLLSRRVLGLPDVATPATPSRP